jgi:hypothetical protein
MPFPDFIYITEIVVFAVTVFSGSTCLDDLPWKKKKVRIIKAFDNSFLYNSNHRG